MRQFPLGRPRARCCNLPTGPAIFERPFLSGSLQQSFSLHNGRKEVADHEHFISPTLSFILSKLSFISSKLSFISSTSSAIRCTASLPSFASRRAKVQRGVGVRSMGLG